LSVACLDQNQLCLSSLSRPIAPLLKAAIFAHTSSIAARVFPSAVGLWLFASQVCAQEAVQSEISTPDYSPLSPREIEILQSGSSPSASPAATASGTLTQTPRRFQYNFSVSERTVYDDNINISNFNRRSDVYFAIEPALSLGFGTSEGINSASLTYRPSVALFLDNSQDDNVQHIIRLQGSHSFGRLSLLLSQDLQILDGSDLSTLSDQTGHNANIDVGGRTRHDIFRTTLNGSYQLTGKLFLSSDANLSVDDYPGPQIGSKSVSGDLFLNYQYREKIVFGLGGTGGYNTVDGATPDQVYEQANFRVGYNTTAKTNLAATVGLEFRQFANNSRGVYVSPVYTLSASYQPFEGTSISLVGSRHTSNSASLAGQDYAETQVNLAVSQRFLQRSSLGIAAGYENAEYFSTISGIAATRSDNYYFIEPTFDISITRFWTAGAYYLRRQNASSLDPFSFYDNQIGFRTVLTF